MFTILNMDSATYNYVIVGKILNVSVLQFFICKMKILFASRVFVRIELDH